MIGEDRKRKADKKALLQSVKRTELSKPKKISEVTIDNVSQDKVSQDKVSQDKASQDNSEKTIDVMILGSQKTAADEAPRRSRRATGDEAPRRSRAAKAENSAQNSRTSSSGDRKRRKHRRNQRQHVLQLLLPIVILAAAIAFLIFAVGKTTGSYGLSGFKTIWNTVILGNESSDEDADGTGAADPAAESEMDAASENGEDAADGSAADATAETETSAYVGELPDIDINSWEYILVNADNPIGEYEPEIAKCGRVEVDTRIVDALNEFVEAAEAQGLPVYLSSAYRSYARQSTLFQRKLSQGYSEEEAATIVAKPGTSEHQTGLAADITDVYRKTKNEELEQTETYQWMSAHCQEYGFIVRFPKDKSDITGIIYEPWHFRYVGVEAATFIMNNNLCLEEFVELYK